MPFPDLPPIVRTRALAACAAAWLDGLPGLVAELEHDWSITVGRSYSGGSEALVAEATLSDGSPAVLKLLLPSADGAAKNEITALRLAHGDGCARLFRADESRGAMLLERLGAPLASRELPEDERDRILCATAQRMWRPAKGAGLQTGAEKGRWLVEFITSTWEQLNRPCSEQAVDYALSRGRSRIAAHDDERAVLVHGDIHEFNALASPDGYKLIDPDGLLAEPEYDLGVIMRVGLLGADTEDPRDRSRALARLTGRDETAIWEWSVVERLSSGLDCTRLGIEPFARQMLAAAEFVAVASRGP